MVRSSDSLATKDGSLGGHSSQNGEDVQRIDTGNIEEAESSLRDGGCLNYEEARALLGRLEYQRGNAEVALRVFEGIDISAITPKIKIAISMKAASRKSRSHWDAPPMSIHAVSLFVEAIFLKASALHDLGRFKVDVWRDNLVAESIGSMPSSPLRTTATSVSTLSFPVSSTACLSACLLNNGTME